MNWKEIDEKCPKAFKHYLTTINAWCSGYEKIVCQSTNKIYQPRDLYDFFDGEGLYIVLHPVAKWKPDGEHSSEWDFSILGNTHSEFGTTTPAKRTKYNERSEVESIAFTKAFELLEEKLAA